MLFRSAISAIGGMVAPAALAYGVGRSVARYASVERAITRIGITAGATAEETKAAFGAIGKASQDYAPNMSLSYSSRETMLQLLVVKDLRRHPSCLFTANKIA